MELLIVTGLSGAGKTRVINALEDFGFYCVDNIPPALLGSFGPAISCSHRDKLTIFTLSRATNPEARKEAASHLMLVVQPHL